VRPAAIPTIFPRIHAVKGRFDAPGVPARVDRLCPACGFARSGERGLSRLQRDAGADNLAVGTNAGEDFSTEGWWTVTPGSCATLVRGPLTGRYLYLYGTDTNGADVLKGAVTMCIDRGKFKVFGIENCWRRGLQAVAFAEIDTQDSPDWTTFLTEPGR